MPIRETQDKQQKAAQITEQLSKFPRQLSCGQRQRAACARALIIEPALIMADEPTGALDSANSKALMQTFSLMNEQLGSTILMVTHDAVVGSYASRVLLLKDEKSGTSYTGGSALVRLCIMRLRTIIGLNKPLAWILDTSSDISVSSNTW